MGAGREDTVHRGLDDGSIEQVAWRPALFAGELSRDHTQKRLVPAEPALRDGTTTHARERAALEGLVEAARAGRGGALVLRGPQGIGKTALLEHAVERASGTRLARCAGVVSELELEFASLHQLCGRWLGRLERLPAPQRDALGAAFGRTPGGSADRRLVSLAVLSLFSDLAAEQPLLCVVDDVQWLDQASAQTLAFVACRLQEEPVALVFAGREPRTELAGLPELVVGGLSDAEARSLLASRIPGPMDEQVRDRIIAESQGNPLALLQRRRGMTPEQLAGGFGLPSALPLVSGIEERLWRRIHPLPAGTRQLLLAAAAEPTGNRALLERAAALLGIGLEAADAARAAGLLQASADVRFSNPMVRSVVYRAAALEDRRSVHRALADAVDPAVDPDRHAWHRAQAAVGPDEQVADELERSAGRARARAGLPAAAAFLERATALTPDPGRRTARALAAAQAKLDAGAPGTALELLAMAEAGPLDPVSCAHLERLRAMIAFNLKRGADASPLLLRAAKTLERLDAKLARETYLQAFEAVTFAGRLAGDRRLVEATQAARAAPPAPEPPGAADLLLDGLVKLFTEGHAAAAPTLKLAIHALRGQDDVRWHGLATRAAVELWDEEMWHALTCHQVQVARETGALGMLPRALDSLAVLSLHTGEPAAALSREAEMVVAATRNAPPPYAPLVLATFRGQETVASELIEATRRDAGARSDGEGIAAMEYATALLQNSLGNYPAALAAARQAAEHEVLSCSALALPELVEAAARSGELGLAHAGLRRLSERTRASRTEWGLGVEARSRALVSEGATAQALYEEAIERLGRCRARTHLARAHLVYGEWLRRERRRLEAREHLRTAHAMFTAIGAGAFAERAARELLATCEHARKRTVETVDQLTAQEAQVARLAREGHSNVKIGAQLFISPRTVEHHLRKVFTKLGISSRSQLDRVLPLAPSATRLKSAPERPRSPSPLAGAVPSR